MGVNEDINTMKKQERPLKNRYVPLIFAFVVCIFFAFNAFVQPVSRYNPEGLDVVSFKRKFR